MARHTHGRGWLRRAVVPLLLVGALALSACDDNDDVSAAGSDTSPAAGDQASDGGSDGSSADDGDSGDSGDSTDGSDEGDGDSSDGNSDSGSDGDSDSGSSSDGDSDSEDPEDFAVDPPADFEGLSRSDVLVTSTKPLPDEVIEKIRAMKGVETALPFSVGSASINGRTLMVAAVDPGTFRQFTPDVTARADFVWERVAGGELAVDSDLDKKLIDKNDMMQLGSDEDSPLVHVGAIAPLIKRSVSTPQERPVIQVIMNEKRGEQLGIQEQNAILIDTGLNTPSALKDSFKDILGNSAIMDTLAIEFDATGQSAVLTGESVSDAVGTFTYTDNPDGTINPAKSWVDEYIRTEEVPILGSVTCNKGMLPQLRGALEDIQLAGLASAIHPDEYAGCYYPRYINHDPSYGLSLHSWGIAVDLNTPGNQRGTVGEMDRRVVAIFKKWGFAWGGDWNYTDPMHFEMSKVVRAGGG